MPIATERPSTVRGEPYAMPAFPESEYGAFIFAPASPPRVRGPAMAHRRCLQMETKRADRILPAAIEPDQMAADMKDAANALLPFLS